MKKIFFLLIIFSVYSLGQEVEIKDALILIEKGNIKEAEKKLKEFQSNNSNNPSVKFLDAVLTSDAQLAIKKFEAIYKAFPNSKYADASLFRIFSYYYALGFYKKADTLLTVLKAKFPNSNYLKTADKTIPDFDDVELTNREQKKVEPNKIDESVSNNLTNFTIQVGAFLNLENANKLADQIKKEGYTTEITQKEIGGSVLNVVYVGNFLKEDEAKKILEIINKKFSVSGRIVSKSK
ncbi:MAG: SPOR domain-containing protein [Melioribacteraceae bacterium]|nr:SPOR domain-containing protein [Melioribacteraceae bacterium]